MTTHAGGEAGMCGENHDHVPIPRSVQSICNMWPGGTSAIPTEMITPLSTVVFGGVKERNCLSGCEGCLLDLPWESLSALP